MTDNNKIKTIIIDDEPDAVNLLQAMLEDFPEVTVAATATDASSAYEAILEHEPDLIFLDIRMPGESGIELTERLRALHRPPDVIFVTAHDQYAISAIKHAAFDYILKPMGRKELKEVILRYETENHDGRLEEKLDKLYEIIIRAHKLRFNTRTGFFLIDPSEIAFFQAEGNYTEIYTATGKKDLVTMNLGHVENMLPSEQFYRISRFNIVNLNCVSGIDRKEGICEIDIRENLYRLHVPRKHMRDLESRLEEMMNH